MTDALRNDLRRMCGERLGPTLRPDTIHSVKSLPKTRSGKIVRGAIKRKYLNEPLGDASSVENPEALDYIGACAAAK
jgi:acetyl-CoA synthetase